MKEYRYHALNEENYLKTEDGITVTRTKKLTHYLPLILTNNTP
jgi:hypothetical protein